MSNNKEYNIAVYLYDIGKVYCGLGEFEYSLASQIAQRAKELMNLYHIHLYFIVPKGKKGFLGSNVNYIEISKIDIALINIGGARLFFARKNCPQMDLVHWTHQTPKINKRLSSLNLITIHDVNFFHNHLKKSLSRKIKRIERSLSRATHISYISKFTQKDVESHFHFPRPSRVILNGVTDLSKQQVPDHHLNIPKEYFFHISRLAAKKNTHLLVEMMKYLPQENLVIAGTGRNPYMQKLMDIIKTLNLSNVYLVGNVSAEQKAALYKNCKGFLFPSLSEGFGLPVVEAMCFGKPVFLSALTSLPEVGGDVSYYFNDLEASSMAGIVQKGISEFKKDKESNEQAIIRHASQFSWEKAAESYISYYLDILSINH